MQPLDFLNTIVPAGGYYAVVGIKNKNVRQKMLSDLSSAEELIERSSREGTDLYFGCSAFATDKGRTKANVLYMQSFWMDLDCGDGTPYETKQDAYQALRSVVKAAGLPKPWVVDSGRGLHVYWPLTTPILAPLWDTYAPRLAALCQAKGLFIKDPGCGTDSARILRIPGTLNHKDPEEPLEVRILLTGAITEWETLKEQIQTACGTEGINGFHPKPSTPAPRRPMDPLTARLAGNIASKFSVIAKKSLQGTGCAVIAEVLTDQANVPEPLWRAVLSIANACDDRETAVHKASNKHPDYNPRETERKAVATTGPYSCETIMKQNGSSRCDGCAHLGKFKSPIALGKVLAEKSSPIREAANPIQVAEPVTIAPAVEGLTEASILPELPWPYSRGINGGIYLPGTPQPDGSNGDPQVVYEYNLDVIRRVKDPEKGETLIVHLELPRDGVREIVMPLSDAQSLDRMKDILSFHGVAAGKKQMEQIGVYMTKVVKHMQMNSPAEPAQTQMGWTEDKKGIVWGRSMFTQHGVTYCPPAHKSATVANMMKEAGTMEAWEALASRYAAPGFELYACCMLMAFGSMLNPYTYEDPVWIHLVSSHSGTGKTTLMNMMNSIWGDPKAMALTAVDTVNSVEKRRVVFNTMAICQDEITNLPAEKLSQLAYAQSQGREKLRLTSGSQEMVNTERRNNTYFSTGNRYISDVLSSHKTNADGEFARLIEIPFQPLQEHMSGSEHFGRVLHNYGHAGPRFAKWLVHNESGIQERVDQIRAKFEKDFRSVSKERNWVATTAAGFAAGVILQQELGILLAYDLKHLYKFWTSHMFSVREKTAQQIVSHEHLLGDFINENYANIIVPDSHAETITDATTASLYGRKTEREARNRLVIRWEKSTQLLFIAQSELKHYCVKRTHSFVDLLAHYYGDKQFKGIDVKRLGAGTGVITSPVKCLIFDVSGGELGELVKEIK